MAKKNNTGESAAVKAFKEKYGHAKKPFPSQEAIALAKAEERNANPAPKGAAAKPVKAKAGKEKPELDPERAAVLEKIQEAFDNQELQQKAKAGAEEKILKAAQEREAAAAKKNKRGR